MNFKKALISVTTVIVFSIFTVLSTTVNADVTTQPIILGITERAEPNEMGYAIGDPNVNTEGNNPAAKIWNIVKYTTMTSNDPTLGNYYCVKAGIGFTDSNKIAAYDVFYNMKTQRSEIQAQNDVLKGIVEGTIDVGEGKTVSRYDAILSILDMMYISGESSESDKKQLLENAGIQEGEFSFSITDSDIVAVQQAALWYFTNYNEENGKYDKTLKTGWLNYTLDEKLYYNLADYNPTSDIPSQSAGIQRQEQAERLYTYIIQAAKDNANNYSESSTATGKPATIDTTTLNYEVSGSNYIVGPIHITQNNTLPYEIEFAVKNNGAETTNYKLLNQNKEEVTQGTTVKDLVGTDFYISLPQSGVTSISVDMNIVYNTTSMTLWASSTNAQEQPVVIPAKQKVEDPLTLTLNLSQDEFDLKLIKRITQVNNQNVPERIESVDVSKLNTVDETGKRVTTGDYQLNKEPVGVKKGDIVTYTFRIYNEGTIDGYAQEITEDIPQGLQFIWSEKVGEELQNDTTLTDDEKEAIEFNQDFLWGSFVYDDSRENIIQISSDYLSKANETTVDGNLIKAFGSNDGTKTESDISYKELSVKFKVVSEEIAGTIIRNEAEISEDSDSSGDPVDDRDSDTEQWVKYEDDEDYDNVTLQSFDLALRKFIMAISNDTTIEDTEYLRNQDGSYTRAPVVDTSKLNTTGEDGRLITTAIYNHTKEPIIVKQKDIVVYMLRVYNEGEIDGYASEIKDHLPPHLEFVEGEFNTQYGWTVSEDGRTVTTRYLEDSMINKISQNSDNGIVLSYKEVPIMCQVKEDAKTSENITNIADITEYLDENKEPVTDRDSQADNVVLPADEQLPGYKDEETGSYVPGQQDDDDFEKVIVKIFDLALRKWVTQAIVIEDGVQTVTETGHQPYDDPEEIVKVELHRKKLDQVVVKFKYSVRVINEGEIAGYAKEVTDYIPQGLRFVAEDNNGWIDEGNNVISTKLLENTLLQPGEYADVEVILTWINNQDNMGVMINTAEISQDYNEYNVPDIDSVPDNQRQGEDDIDDAPVMLSITTGQMRIYFTLGFIVLITVAGGVILIKRFVL